VTVSASLASGAWGQTTTIDPAKAKDWLEQTFGIVSVRVVKATPDELVTLRSLEQRSPSDFHAIVHLEDFHPLDPLSPPSSDQEFFINCPSRRFHVERIETFSQNGGRGSQATTFGPTAWGKPVPNSTEERVVAAVCGPVMAAAAVPAEPKTPPTPPVIATPKPLTAAVGRPAARQATPSPPSAPARVQLFAGVDRTAAQRFLDVATARLPPAARKPEIVEAITAGHPIFRVQIAGFASAAAAAHYCSAVKTAGLDCFVPPSG
jgi:hypothetical protein